MVKKGKKRTCLTLVIDDPSWRRFAGLPSRLNKAAMLTLTRLPGSLAALAGRVEFTLLLTSDKAVKNLNYDFRGLAKPTNVLSFPQHTRRQLTRLRKEKEPVYLGDVAVAYRYTIDEARKENKNAAHHVTHLMVHGLLHLFGYDHHTAAAAVRMERLEKKLMAELGLPDPYAPFAVKARPDGGKKRRAS